MFPFSDVINRRNSFSESTDTVFICNIQELSAETPEYKDGVFHG